MKLKEIIQDISKFDYYQNLIKYQKPKNVYDSKQIIEFGWGLIKETQYNISQGKYDIEKIFTDFTGIQKEEIINQDAIAFASQINWILDELKKLTEREAENLSSELNPKQIQAGYEKLNRFGYFGTLDALAGGHVWRYNEIEETEYHIIYTKLLLQKTKTEIDIEYNRILNDH